jgi:hypothetical protein
MLIDAYGRTARPGGRSTCPGCDGELVAKCGSIKTWHWAHLRADCDPWSEPESAWHLGWKRWLADHRGARTEVVMPPHRADAVLPDGRIVELQGDYLSAEQIAEREAFYGPDLVWIYRCHWSERIHVGRRGFWWKHGAPSMAAHRRPVWWELSSGMVRVHLNVVESEYGHRVLGTVQQSVRSRREMFAPVEIADFDTPIVLTA